MLTFMSVILDSSSNNQIIGNNITSQHTGYGYGVQVNSGSFNNIIIGNTFTEVGIGVRVQNGHHTTVSKNHFERGQAS